MKDNAEDLDIVMPMYNLLEYSQNYSITSNYGIIIEMKLMMLMIMLQIVNHLFIKQTVGITPERPGNEGGGNLPSVPTLNVEVTIPLRHLNNFWRSLDLPLINCKKGLN